MTDPHASEEVTPSPGRGATPPTADHLFAMDPASLSPEGVAKLRDALRASQEALSRQDEQLRETRAALAETRERFADLYECAPIGFLSLDAAGGIVAANRQAAAMLGHTPETLPGQPFSRFVARADQPCLRALRDRAGRTGERQTAGIRLLRPDQTGRYVEIAATPAGRPTGPDTGRGLHIALSDLPPRRESEEALRLADGILETGPAFLLRFAVSGEEPGPVEYVSANIDRFGFSREKLISGALLPRELVHADDLPKVEAALRENAVAGNDACILDYRLRTGDGQTRYVTDHARLLRDAFGRVNAVQSLVLDVTDSALARQDLETVLDSAPIPIVKVRVTPHGDRILEYQNPAAARLFGEAALGKSCKAYLCKKETCPALSADSGVVRDRECAVTTLRGERVMYKTAHKLPDGSGIIEAMVDVTELMRTRQNLTRAMEAAEAANKAKSEFLATMSHEIRTPINGIMGMTELALQTDLTGEQREYLDLARQSALSLLDIVNDILDFSRIEAGRVELSAAPFSPRRMLGRCLRLFDTLAARHGNTLSLSVHPDVPETLIGDAGRLGQVVANLVSNGLKFTRNGDVRLCVEPDTQNEILCADPSDTPPGNRVSLLFSVIDTGIGIPAAKQDRIFEPFTQLDGSLTRGVGGTGLGLSICNNLVALMGGRLWLSSRPGKGSTFYFTTVCRKKSGAARQRPETTTARAPLPALSILLVEDNCINQLVGKRLLERRGHGVTAVDSGAAALALLAKRSFDCVLMDVEMPELNGLEALARLRDPACYGERADTPVVALTAHAVRGYREKMLAAGFDDYVSKPIDMRQLEAALRRALARPRRRGGGAGA
ncbi:PAS/PAC sensor hybrid histidine kinase [Solidesulfovibrio fructosivorans JJ]]|uniref:Sensory/regulatory protein RpfC n=1 Tax=Solidesulfovibrio fructosivorans JJ] TaxID=596151 RepID=E1JXH7_SOLFR|nr:ATP-binding protein [Solidesulfovibrio fructosivorans]EFL50954.1 PAS/PAC sensor hybrid histidine kinase [Solidesulfovibrio fructosivorans JJ]]